MTTTTERANQAETEEPWDGEHDDESRGCWYCGGEGWGIVDLDFPCDDPLWDLPGSVIRCRCCGGTGDAKDCTFW